jgi:hypothetical protein
MTKVLLLLAVSLLSAACNGSDDKEISSMTPFKHLKTECIGRVLIGLPNGVESWTQMVEAIDIKRSEAKDEKEFWAGADAEEATLRASKHDDEGSLLSHVSRGDPSRFLFHRKNSWDRVGYQVKGFYWAGRNGYLANDSMLSTEKFEDVVRIFTHPFIRLKNRSPDDAALAEGFCIDGAIVTGPPNNVTRADYNVRPIERPGLSIGLLVEENQEHLGGSAFDSLKTEERSAGGRGGEVGLKQFKVLRKQQRNLDGFDGEETISLTELKNGTKLYSFRWRTLGQLKSIVSPHITITMDTNNPLQDGTYIKTPPAEEMIGLWDAVLDSLRHRPGALPPGAK